MRLTVCLVTKGREKYIDEALNSFVPFLKDKDVDIFLIDNGSDPNCQEKLEKWQSAHASGTKLIRFSTNDSRYSRIWPLILGAGIDWIVMPGDDDRLRPEIVTEWKEAISENPEIVAFASSARVMNETGVLSDVVLQPTVGESDSKMEQLATAFHGPAFVWPGLFFRVSKVDPHVPPSRYAFDWWVGLNLLMHGDIKVTSSIGIDYRIHSDQETSLAPLRRKFFEGAMWIEDLIAGDSFAIWLTALSDEERISLWEAVISKRPIYDDIFYGRHLLFSLGRLLIGSTKDVSKASRIVGDLASLAGVFLKDGEIANLLRNEDLSFGSCLGNVRLRLATGTCHEVVKASEQLVGLENARVFDVSCCHSKKIKGGVFVNCSAFAPSLPETNADLVINAITDFCENRNEFEMALSSGERRTLLTLRSLQNKLPVGLKTPLRRIKHSGFFRP